MNGTKRFGLLWLAACLAVSAAGSTARAQVADWSARVAPTDQPVTAIRQVGSDVFVEAGRWFRAVACYNTVCLQTGRPPAQRTSRFGIPGGAIAEADGQGAVQAWYANPTERYDHGILGDQIEGGSLVVIDDEGQQFTAMLSRSRVFEDLTPRIADMDGDGRNDVVVIRTELEAGAAVAIYSIANGVLVELASIPPIGQTHRWLNIAGIADFNGDGHLDIAVVKTPHIGGRLEIWTLSGGQLVLLAAGDGFSNHSIGTTELGLSAVADADADGIADLALPNNDHTMLRIVGLGGGTLHDIATVPLGGPVTTAIATLEVAGRPAFLAGLADGRLVVVRPTP